MLLIWNYSPMYQLNQTLSVKKHRFSYQYKKMLLYLHTFLQRKQMDNQYNVAFTGLKNGVHSFNYTIDDEFFKEREYSPIQSGHIDVELDFDKRDQFFVLDFRYAGTVDVECDRCTDKVTIPVSNSMTLLVKISEEEIEDIADDEVMYIQPKDIKIDFSQFLYENIIVNIPLHKTCEDDISGEKECDEEVVSILENDNSEDQKETDPRWEKLKELQKLNNHGTSKE